MPDEAPTGTVTFLFTDIEGSTIRWEQHRDLMDVALQRHDEIIRRAVGAHGGCVFSAAGDGFAAAFARAADALVAALRIQRALHAERWRAPLDLAVRIGLHTGEARERSGTYFGTAVNRAARVMATAGGGQILMSSAVREIVTDELPSGVSLVDLGEHALKGLSRPERIYGVIADGIAGPRIAADSLHPGRGNLAAPASEFVGRRDAIGVLTDLVPRRRLVTLVGPGGVGKTRLSLEVGLSTADAYDDGTWLVELAGLDDDGLVPEAVASTLGLRPQPGLGTVDMIVDGLRARRLLLIVDNCEHVLGAAAELAARIATACPRVSVLATSREPLNVDGEQVWPVRTLNPGTEGVELFLDRARNADATFASTEQDLAAIERLCAHLDGIPLAIELAAGRCRMFGPAELLDRLAERLTLLRTSQRGRPPRHQTLQAMVDWSYRLLEPDVREMFDNLSVFAGTFDVAAAAAVVHGIDATPPDAADTAELLSLLVDRSFVIADRTTHPGRYRLLETLRLFGEQQMEAAGTSRTVRERHLAHYVRLATTLDVRFRTNDVAGARLLFDLDWDNLRAAFLSALADHRVEHVIALLERTFWYATHTVRAEHGAWVAKSLAAGVSSPSLRGMSAYWLLVESAIPAALHAAEQGIADASEPHHPKTAICWYSRSLALLNIARPQEANDAAAEFEKAAADRFEAAFARYAAVMSDVAGDPDQRRRDAEQLLALADGLGNSMLQNHALLALGSVQLQTADPAGAETSLRRAVRCAVEDENAQIEHVAAAQLLRLLVTTPGSRDVDAAFQEYLPRMFRHRHWFPLLLALTYLAIHWTQTAAVPDAARLLGFLEAQGAPRSAALVPLIDDATTRARATEEGDVAFRQGQELDRDELIALVLHRLAPEPN